MVTPQKSLMSLTLPLSSSSSKSSSGDNLPSPSRKVISLNDSYERTNFVDDNVTLYYHFNTSDPVVFEDTIKKEKWRIVIDEEIISIEKNDTQKLIHGLKEKTLNRCQDKVSGKKFKIKNI